MVVGNDGVLISIAALNLHSDFLKNVYQIQFVQIKAGELMINIVPKKNFSVKDEERIKSAFYKKLGNELFIIINLIDKLPLTEIGENSNY